MAVPMKAMDRAVDAARKVDQHAVRVEILDFRGVQILDARQVALVQE